MKENKKSVHDKYLYFEIAEKIRQNIENKKMLPGKKLPTEEKFCEEYKVSRVTIRHALNYLKDIGVISKGYRQSAYVKEETLTRDFRCIKGLSEEIEATGKKVFSYIFSSKVVEAEEYLSTLMSIPYGCELLKVERIRYLNNKPLCFQKLYLINEMFAGLEVSRLVNEPLYKVLKEFKDISVVKADQQISAITADKKLSELLEVEERTAILKTLYRGYTQENRCIEYSENYYIGELYDIDMEIN